MIPPLLPTYNRAPLAFERGEGSWLVERGGGRYLDLGAGIAVNALGHAHPALVEALTAQAGAVWHTSNLYEIPAQQRLAERLVEATFADTCFFTNSGTEACELAVKMARKHFSAQGSPERHVILAFTGSFHGRSSAGIAAAGSEKMTAGFGPLLPGFRHLPFGDHAAFEAAIREPDVAAVILEPVQGEGGIVPVPDQCLKGVREACDQVGALMILDEVQCGMGRTGRLFAHEWAGVAPDIMMVAKGIGGGFPLGALLATEAAASAMTAGTHGSTYGGNPLACAVGNAVVEIVADEAFLSEVRRKGGLLRQGLEGLVAAHPEVFERVQGAGLMLGLRCRIPVARVIEAACAESLLLVPAANETARILPALNIEDADIREALDRLDRAAAAVTAPA
ncbi:aspartate aminotransferase family protein [Jannaschia sp. W003]|uniref:aspartate aminotransferase family protein n=1 Tax=Jannaschia sp. W003 TaxID=2867012 RepID=UPI0021A56ED4|nr:aspartate aminotransferase family protein [Jannaschia sp. W003]UWQ22577.1 aspartate aminotransferase family protein [Jannaschia sp. W003]